MPNDGAHPVIGEGMNVAMRFLENGYRQGEPAAAVQHQFGCKNVTYGIRLARQAREVLI
jgi:hypothetical protein